MYMYERWDGGEGIEDGGMGVDEERMGCKSHVLSNSYIGSALSLGCLLKTNMVSSPSRGAQYCNRNATWTRL